MNRDQAQVRAEQAARRHERALRGDPDNEGRPPTFRKAVVTSDDPLEVSTAGGAGLPAANWCGQNLNVGDRVLLLVDAGRRMVIGTPPPAV